MRHLLRHTNTNSLSFLKERWQQICVIKYLKCFRGMCKDKKIQNVVAWILNILRHIYNIGGRTETHTHTPHTSYKQEGMMFLWRFFLEYKKYFRFCGTRTSMVVCANSPLPVYQYFPCTTMQICSILWDEKKNVDETTETIKYLSQYIRWKYEIFAINLKAECEGQIAIANCGSCCLCSCFMQKWRPPGQIGINW